MSPWGNLQLIVIFIGITIVSFAYFLTNVELETQKREGQLSALDIYYVVNDTSLDRYLVNTPSCQIMRVDPWDISMKKFYKPLKQIVCSQLPPLTYIERRKGKGNILKVEESLRKKYKSHPSHNIVCCYSVITREVQNLTSFDKHADNLYKLSSCQTFKKESALSNTTESVLVKCTSVHKSGKSKEVYKNTHALVPILPRVTVKLKKFHSEQELIKITSTFSTENVTRPKNERRKLNVLVIGIDSVSRLGIRRTMPKTFQYLQENKWIELNGYNKIGDNTFPNLMAILTGQNVSQIRKSCQKTDNASLDDCNYIWKDFHERGFVTAYAEDMPSISTFNYLRTGFVRQPTDYYMRPFMLASHNLLPNKDLNSLTVCVGPSLVAELVLNYARDFVATFNEYLYFGLFWINNLSHNNINAPTALDFRLKRFLDSLSETGAYDNSVIFLLSDHGMRFGEVRRSFVAFYEERLPFIYIWFPKWFRKKYYTTYRNLLINQNRLSTPYDIHVTIRQILEGKVELEPDKGDGKFPIDNASESQFPSEGCSKCGGLFNEISTDRRCEDAAIDQHWCMCNAYEEVSVSDKKSSEIAEFLAKEVNERKNKIVKRDKVNETLCNGWSLSRLVRIHQSVKNTKNPQTASSSKKNVTNDDETTYVVAILADRGAVFEASVYVTRTDNSTKMEASEFISRLDYYSTTSKCVQSSHLLKFYCNCVTN